LSNAPWKKPISFPEQERHSGVSEECLQYYYSRREAASATVVTRIIPIESILLLPFVLGFPGPALMLQELFFAYVYSEEAHLWGS
jgi:hypothetical protein